jgi:hypothetical protein
MSAATLAPSPSFIPASPDNCNIPGALQQFLQKIEEQGNANLTSLKADVENKWRTASSEGLTSSTMLYEVLAYGWKELRRITA